MRPILPIVLALSLPLAVTAQQSDTQPITISARRMVDVQRGTLIEDAVVVVLADRIVAAGARSSIATKGRVTDLGDVTLLPGLIDAHVHLTLGGAAEANARATLLAGFTTVQDLGALNYANIRVRDDISSATLTTAGFGEDCCDLLGSTRAMRH